MTDTRSNESADSGPGVKTAAPKFGRFSYDASTRKMIWSERTYAVFGLTPSEVVPTLAVMSSHQHPDDRAGWDKAVARALAEGVTFCQWHRIIDTKQRVHSALTVAYATSDGAGGVAGISGFVVDMTATLRRDREQETTQAVLQSAATRDLIEQAKGMLMVIFDLTDTQAFDLLRWHSSYNNIKVREVASTLVDRLIAPELAGLQPRQRLTTILAGLRRGTGSSAPAPAPSETYDVQVPQPAADDRPAPSSSKRISNADLPRTMMRAVSVAAQSISIADWLDPEQPLVYVNDAFATLTGYPADEILGRNCRFLQGPGSDPKVVKEMRGALNAGREVRTVLRNYRRDGTAFWNEVHLSAVRDDAGRITHYIGYQSDVSERVEREQQLRQLAYRDARTGLPNEAAALRDLEASILGANKAGSGFTVIAGSSASPSPALVQQVRDAAPSGSFVSMLRDDTLLIRLPADAVTEAVTLGDGTITSWGVARFPEDAGDAASLIAKARAATNA